MALRHVHFQVRHGDLGRVFAGPAPIGYARTTAGRYGATRLGLSPVRDQAGAQGEAVLAPALATVDGFGPALSLPTRSAAWRMAIQPAGQRRRHRAGARGSAQAERPGTLRSSATRRGPADPSCTSGSRCSGARPAPCGAGLAGGRFPPLDRLDLIEHGRLLAGTDVRDGITRPVPAELLAAGAEFALGSLGGDPGLAQRVRPWPSAARGTTIP